MMEMDAATSARYKAWMRRKILKRIALPGLLLLLLLASLILGLRSCGGNGEETENGDISTETRETDPEETDNLVENPDAELMGIRIQFAGDILLHRGPIEAARTGENTFDFRPFLRDIKPFIDGDLSIANMETPVDVLGGNQDITTFPLFNAPFEILEALQYAGFNHLISANNHSFDRGFDGLVATVNNFERVGIDHTGMNVDEAAFNTPTILDVNGIQVGIIAYTDSVNGLEPLVPDAMLPYAVRRFRSNTLDDIPYMAEDIARLRTAGAELVIVSLHWGAEYVDSPTEMQQLIARELSEVGADIIMGNHAHVIQPVEWHYRADGSRSFIIYSLGNFLADQTRLVTPIPRTQYGKLVSVQVVRESDGEIRLERAEVLPTLCMRDFTGNILGNADNISVLPIFDGEVPEFITDEEVRAWGRRAYEHVVNIVGEEFIARPE